MEDRRRMKTGMQGAIKMPYEKPVVLTIDLVAEEVLAPGCKLASGGPSAPRGATCTQANCVGAGS